MFSNYRTFSWNKGQHCIVAMLLGLCFFVAPAGAQKKIYTYQKSLGKSGKTIQSPYGYDMQFAHEDRVIIYRIPSTTPFMLWRNAEAFYTYARWYNYENNQTIPGLTLKSVTSKSTTIYEEKNNLYATANSGQIWCKTSGYQQFCSNAEYTYNPSNGTDVVYIGCDQSSYLDTKVDATNLTFTEPTLSQRMVFEIHPASEMAAKVDACASGKWLEEYDIMASTGSTVYLGPKYAILDAQMKSSIESGSLTGTTYPAYYYTNAGVIISSGSSAFLTNSGSSPQCTITNDNWVEADATVTQTTTYECIQNYSINCPTWNLSAADFSNPTSITSNGVRSGEHTENGLTWHWELRPFKSKSPTPNASYLGQVGDYVQIGNTDDNYRSDSLIVTVTIPDDKTIDNIYVDCYSEYTNSNPPRICIWSRASNSDDYVDHKTQYLGGTASKPISIDIVPHEYYVNDKKRPLVNKVIQVVLGPQTIASATFIKSICITYKDESTHHIQGEVQKTEPADAEKAYWKKVVVDNTVKHWSKQQTIACTTAGWIWIKNGVMQEVDITKMSAGQYIPLDPVISQRVDTLELVYNSGQGTGTTTFQRDTTINHRTVYLYSSETNQWVEKADSTQHIVMPAAETSKTTNSSSSAKQYHIAQFRVQYLDRDIVGPRAAELNDFVNNMELIAEQDFNFGYGENKLVTTITDANKDNARVFYPHPLDAEASYYGFYYGSDADRNGSYKAKCSFNEYQFVNNGFGWKYNDALSNHVGNSTNHDKRYGFALYADGSQKPGTVFTIEFGAQLCPGAKMFFSAWIGDQNPGSYTTGHPIFNFYVEGLDAEGNAHVLATFTTGEFVKKEDKWHHILFPLEFSDDIDYERFRYRIENMAATTSNNDFFLDDVRVYLQRAEISPVQASLSNHASCLYERQDMVLYTRVDYGEMMPEMEQTTSDTRSFYYRWYDANGDPVPASECNYAGPDVDSNGKPFGKVTIPSDPNDLPSKHIMASFSEFDNTFHNRTIAEGAVVKYIQETWFDQDQDQNLTTISRYVAYIATPVKAHLGKKYRCVVTYAKSLLPDKDATIDQTELCSSKADVRVVNGLCIRCKELGGLVPGGTQAQANANNAYELTLVSETMRNKNNTVTRQVDCYFGYWLFGREIKSGEYNADKKRQQLEALYGTTYDNVKAAIQAYIANPVTADADQKKIVKRLSTIGALKLSNSKLMADTSFLVLPLYDSDTISFTAFPFCDLTGSKEFFCHEPISISLTFPTDLFKRNSLYFVKNQNEKVPEFLPNLHPRQVRIPKNSEQQYVPIRLTNTTSTYVLKTARLYSTNNTAVPADVATNWNWMDDVTTNQTITGEEPHKVLFKDLNKLPEGYKYTFRVAYDVTDQVQGATPYEGEAFITFIVVPDVVYYAGSKGDVWNDDEKWQFKKTDGKKAAAFVPLPSTKVVFQNDYVVLPPYHQPAIQDQPGLQEKDVEADAVPYITYDINYVPYSCSNVYIARGVSILGQQRLTTINTNGVSEPTKWTLELPVLTQKWKMNAIPLQSVVLGDMFVPAAGESTTDLFDVKAISQNPGEYASDRVIHSFYNSLYNKDAKQYLGKGEYESIKNSTWTFATNILKEPVTPGYGWALGYDGDIANFSIRLPKVDKMYRYFNRNAGELWTREEEYPDRTNAGKAMFTPDPQDPQGKMTIKLTNDESSNIFLFGNPTFAYIDLAKLMEADVYNNEVATNPIEIVGFYKAGVSANSRYQLAAATTAETTWLTSINQSLLTADDDMGLLAPTEAVFIKLNTSCTTIRFDIALSMLCDKGDTDKKYYGDDTPTPLSAPASYTTDDNVADDYANADASAIFISASLGNYESSTSIYDHPEAEVELFMLDKAKTPFAIYTVGNNKALAINHLRDDQTRIPLVMFAEDPVERPLFAFEGEARYLVEWDLVDINTGVRQPLYEGLTMRLNMPQDGSVRYYLERSRHGIYTSESKTEAFQTYAYGGMLTIYSEEPLYDLRIYDPAGRLLCMEADAGTSYTANLTAGTYIIRASGSTCKVIVP